MERFTRNRTNYLILLVIVLGLVSLGMKLPDLHELACSPIKPKPRPRAVVKTQIKSCQESIKKIQVDVTSDRPVRFTLYPICILSTLSRSGQFVTLPSDPVVGQHFSRAPPANS